jgi:uncharacterized phage-associated protein
MATIYEVADHLLANSACGLSNRELQKLLYLAQGFHLAQTGESLFTEDFQAWRHGPVHSGIYHKFKTYGYHSIDKPTELKQLEPKIAAFIAAIAISFSGVGQQNLIEFSHMDSPWASKYIPDANVILSKDEIRQYFSNFSSHEEYLEYSRQKLEFHNLILSRATYLESLPQIGDAWISGKASAPSDRVCATAKAFLCGMERQMFSAKAKPAIPKIIMGPIPSGGVSLEITASFALYLHFHNNGEVEIEMDKDDHFTDYVVSIDQFEENRSAYYGAVLS